MTLRIAFIVFALISGALCQATIPCNYTDPNTGYIYDLSPLANGNTDYVVQVLAGQDNITTQSYQIVLNVCRPIKDQTCFQQAGSNCDACQEWPIPNVKYANALGKTSSTTFYSAQDTSGENEEGVTMYYSGFTSTLAIDFVCDTTAKVGKPTYVTKPDTYEFLLQWKTTYACAVSGPRSRLYCDCDKADLTVCSEQPCPKDVDDVCTYQCFAYGGVGNAANNYCNYDTSSDICS